MKLSLKQLPDGDFAVYAGQEPTALIASYDKSDKSWDLWRLGEGDDKYGYFVMHCKSRILLLEQMQVFANALTAVL